MVFVVTAVVVAALAIGFSTGWLFGAIFAVRCRCLDHVGDTRRQMHREACGGASCDCPWEGPDA